MAMVRRFFQDYKQLEGKEVEVDEILPAAQAYPIIENALSSTRRSSPGGLRSDRRFIGMSHFLGSIRHRSDERNTGDATIGVALQSIKFKVEAPGGEQQCKHKQAMQTAYTKRRLWGMVRCWPRLKTHED